MRDTWACSSVRLGHIIPSAASLAAPRQCVITNAEACWSQCINWSALGHPAVMHIHNRQPLSGVEFLTRLAFCRCMCAVLEQATLNGRLLPRS